MNHAHRWICIVATVFSIFSLSAAGESSLSWRIFKNGDNTWICHPDGILLFSSLSRTLKPFNIDPVRSIDTLADYIEDDGFLWVATNAGLYQIEMTTQSIERIPLSNDSAFTGKIAVDGDYLWMGTDLSLFRFDKLGREWMKYDLSVEPDRIAGLWTNGNEVFRLGHQKLFRFTTGTEKWNVYPLDRLLSDTAIFYPGTNTFKVIDGKSVSLYQPESFAWVHTNLSMAPRDIFDEDSVVYCSDTKTVERVACVSGLTRTLNLPNPGVINAIAKTGDSLIMSTDKQIGKFSLARETMDYLEYDPQMETGTILKIIPLGAFNLLVSPSVISIYEKSTKTWQHISRTGLQSRSRIFSWNQEECVLRYSPGYQTKISGYIETGMTFDWLGYDTIYPKKYFNSQKTTDGRDTLVRITDSTVKNIESVFELGNPSFKGDINIHSTDQNDRVLDVYLNNTSRLSPPEKGIYYRGNRNDYLNSMRIGTQDNGQIVSPLMPTVALEGGSAVIESKARLTARDRKKLRLATGAGFVTTQTVKKIIPYHADGIYKFSLADTTDSLGDTLRYVKQSCRVFVDGEELDTTQFTFNTTRGQLSFNTLAPIDPASAIIVEYKVQTIPDGDISSIKFLPDHHFGEMYYGALTYSPSDWISLQAGYTGINRKSCNNIATVAVPLEFRNTEKKFMLQFKPELLYNLDNKSKAASAQLQTRIGEKTGIVANALFSDSAVVSADILTLGYGVQKGEYDFTLSHDIRQELPLSYYQCQKFGIDGAEYRYALTAGARFKGLPFLEISLARTVIEKNNTNDSTTAIDSLYHIKDKLKLRLYETSSALLQKLTHCYKISYDLTHAENVTEAPDSNTRIQGRLTTGSFLISPIQRIMLSGELFYRGNIKIEGMPSSDIKPSLNLQVSDAPPGVDMLGNYNLKFSKFSSSLIASDTIYRSAGVVLKPGKWTSVLGWFSLNAKINQTVNCRFNTTDVPFGEIISGNSDQESSSLSKELGINIYPLVGLLMTNSNNWSSTDTQKTFSTANKIHYSYNAANILSLDWNYYSTGEKHQGSLLYEKLWTPWLRTSTALKADIDQIKGGNLKAGPKVLVILSAINKGFIYALSNTHDIDVMWKRTNGVAAKNPDISYSFGLKVKFKPNLELQVSNTKCTFTGGQFSDFSNSTILMAYF